MRKFLRRFGWVRYCILQHITKVRKEAAMTRWEYRRSMLSLIGQVTITWAGIESMIDALVIWYHPIKGQSEISAQLPVNFGNKMDYVNKMSRDPGFGADGQRDLLALRAEAKRLNIWRKTLLHGVVFHRHFMGTEWEVQIRRFSGATSTTDSYIFDDAAMRDILTKMSDFSHAISPWIARITGLTP